MSGAVGFSLLAIEGNQVASPWRSMGVLPSGHFSVELVASAGVCAGDLDENLLDHCGGQFFDHRKQIVEFLRSAQVLVFTHEI